MTELKKETQEQIKRDVKKSTSSLNEKSRWLLSEAPVFKALIIFSIPAIIGMTIQGSYTFADKLIITKWIGVGANSGLLIAEQLVMIVFGFGFLINTGASSLFSIALGAKEEEKAKKIIATGSITSIAVGLLSTLFVLTMYRPIMELMGAGEDQIGYAADYLKIVAWGFPLLILGNVLLSVMRAEGKMKLSALIITASAITNIGIDLLLVVGFGWGIEGAAFATLFGGYGLTVIIPIIYAIKNKDTYLRFNWIKVGFYKLPILGAIALIGVPAFIGNMTGNLVAMVATSVFATLSTTGIDFSWTGGSDISEWQAVMAGAAPTLSLLMLPLIGVVQGQMPLLGYALGAKDTYRLKNVFTKGLYLIAAYCGLISITMWFAGGFFIGWFNVPAEFNKYVKWMYVLLPSVAVQYQVRVYFQVTKRVFKATFLAVLRNIIIFIPLMLLVVDKDNPVTAFKVYMWSDLIALAIAGAMFFSIRINLLRGKI